MTCDQFQHRLSAYLDGELSRWSRWKVQTHLRFCPECGDTMRDLAEVDTGLLALARETPSPDYLTASVMRRLPAMPPGRPLRRRALPWAAGLAVAGMQVLAVVGAYHWGFTRGSGVNQSGAAGSGVGPVSTMDWSAPRTAPVELNPRDTLQEPRVNPGVLAIPRHRFSSPDPRWFAAPERKPLDRSKKRPALRLTQPALKGAH